MPARIEVIVFCRAFSDNQNFVLETNLIVTHSTGGCRLTEVNWAQKHN